MEEATSYLLEESGDYAGAFTILHRVAKDNLHRFIERCERQFEHKAATSIDLGTFFPQCLVYMFIWQKCYRIQVWKVCTSCHFSMKVPVLCLNRLFLQKKMNDYYMLRHKYLLVKSTTSQS